MSDSSHSDGSNYGYVPAASWSIALIVLFGLSAAVHSYQAFRSRYWIAYPTLVLGALIEILGWSGRLWSHYNVTLLTPFLMQICTLIMAPVFFSAYDYIILGIAIRRLGPEHSLLRPSWYFIVFLTADIISLILQAVGGGQAASSAADSAPTDSATNIMVAGIIFQLVSMAIFVTLGFDFIFRANARRPYAFRQRQIAAKIAKRAAIANDESHKSSSPVPVPAHRGSDATIVGPTAEPKLDASPDRAMAPATTTTTGAEPIEARENLTRWWIMLGGCLVSSMAIVVRGVYRSIELSEGWSSAIAQDELLQGVLDGVMMVVAVGIFNFLNPLYLLPKRPSWKGFH